MPSGRPRFTPPSGSGLARVFFNATNITQSLGMRLIFTDSQFVHGRRFGQSRFFSFQRDKTEFRVQAYPSQFISVHSMTPNHGPMRRLTLPEPCPGLISAPAWSWLGRLRRHHPAQPGFTAAELWRRITRPVGPERARSCLDSLGRRWRRKLGAYRSRAVVAFRPMEGGTETRPLAAGPSEIANGRCLANGRTSHRRPFLAHPANADAKLLLALPTRQSDAAAIGKPRRVKKGFRRRIQASPFLPSGKPPPAGLLAHRLPAKTNSLTPAGSPNAASARPAAPAPDRLCPLRRPTGRAFLRACPSPAGHKSCRTSKDQPNAAADKL